MAKFIAFILVLFITAPLAALADGTSTPQDALKQRLALVDAKLVAGGKLGMVDRERLTDERRSIQDLIHRLESGAKVAPEEIDRLVGVQPLYIQQPAAARPFTMLKPR